MVISLPQNKLIQALESELVKYDELLAKVEEERARKKLEEPEPEPEDEKKPKSEVDSGIFGTIFTLPVL